MFFIMILFGTHAGYLKVYVKTVKLVQVFSTENYYDSVSIIDPTKSVNFNVVIAFTLTNSCIETGTFE